MRSIFLSSPGVKRGFCNKCGTPLTYEGDRCEGKTHIYLSNMDNPDHYPSTVHVFRDEKISWFEIVDNLSRHKSTDDN